MSDDPNGQDQAGNRARLTRPASDPRPIKRLVAITGCVAAAGGIVGCGGAGTVATAQIGVAACRQAASSLTRVFTRREGSSIPPRANR